jgi:hypothetical protein
MEFNKMMMKKFILLMLISLSVSGIKAQTFNEWFRQKKTQIQYLVDQITALKVYSKILEKGYQVANVGLKFIDGIKKVDFDLHELYFNSLKKVNPTIISYSRIAGIIVLEKAILMACERQKKSMSQSMKIAPDEMKYAEKVFNNLLDQCSKTIDQLTKILEDGNFQMQDDERIKIIDESYQQMQDRYVFVEYFINQISTLGIQRMKGQNDIQTLRDGFGIN